MPLNTIENEHGGAQGECEIEERTGPGPELDFGFKGRMMLFRYVS